MSHINKARIDWIDVCKAFAIFFIYFGHWITKNGNLGIFAYSFHLQLFFVLSGFFAINQQKKPTVPFLKNQAFILLVPFLFFSVLNIVYFALEGEKTLSELTNSFLSNFTDFSKSVAPELWFLPALFWVAILYYFLLKLIKKPWIVLSIAYALYIIQNAYSDSPIDFILVPFVKILGIWNIPQYLFWYSLGSVCFPFIKRTFDFSMNSKGPKKSALIISSISIITLTILIYLFKQDAFWNKFVLLFDSSQIINNSFVLTNFRIVITIIICVNFIILSFIFRESKFLLMIGKNTLILLGFEFIIKNFLVLNLFPMLNIGIITLETTVQVIIISALMILSVVPLFKPLNEHLPFLIGKRK